MTTEDKESMFHLCATVIVVCAVVVGAFLAGLSLGAYNPNDETKARILQESKKAPAEAPAK